MYNDISTKVTWNGNLGKEYINYQGNGQGGKGIVLQSSRSIPLIISTAWSNNLGSQIRTIHTATLACANDVILMVDAAVDLQVQLSAMANINNMHRLNIHPLKTCNPTSGLHKMDDKFNREHKPWPMNTKTKICWIQLHLSGHRVHLFYQWYGHCHHP